MTNTALSRYDILAKELVYKNKDKDATGQVALKNPKWTPHNIKTLMICSEGCLVEYYSNKAPDLIRFTGYTEDEKSKPISAVIYDLNKVSAHLTNLRDLIIVTGGDLPLERAVDVNRLRSLSSAFIGVYLLVSESANSTLDDLKALHDKMQEQVKVAIAELCAKAHDYEFNMGLEDSGVWKVCTGSRKPNGQPYELSFKSNEVTLNGNKKSLEASLQGVLSYGLFVAGRLPHLNWMRFGQASFMEQSFHTNRTDYPADTGLLSYVTSRYLCMYELLGTVQSRSRQSVFSLSKEDRELAEACLTLFQWCHRAEIAEPCFKGAMHYLKGSDLAEGTQEVFEANISWLLSMICSESDYAVWSTYMSLPDKSGARTNERLKKFAVQCFARCVMSVALCIESVALLGKAKDATGTPDGVFCSMRHALVFGSRTGLIPDSLTNIAARILQVVVPLREDIAQGIVSGAKCTLWKPESSTKVTKAMVEQHSALIKTVILK